MPTVTTLAPQEIVSRFAAIVGADHVELQDAMVRVAPASAEEVAAVLRFASEHALVLVATGNSTKLGWGNPVAPSVELSLTRMNALKEHAWEDLTCTVQAGCTWSAMQQQLAEHGQTVALDPLWPERATVGGIVATNDSGALRARYGGLRDLIIGMTVVLADGTIARSGGKVVKNVAGYDLHKLFTGSFGTLGVITEVNFRLHPIEQHSKTLTVSASSINLLAAPLSKLLHAQLSLSCLQMRMADGKANLDVRIATRPECMNDHEDEIAAAIAPLSAVAADDLVWQARENLFSDHHALILKASLLPSELCAVARELEPVANAEGLSVRIVAQAAGLATIALAPANQETTTALVAVVNHLRARLRASGGSAVFLQVPDELRGKIDVWDCQSDALPLMREIKRRFDPNRVLSPGRFVGGI